VQLLPFAEPFSVCRLHSAADIPPQCRFFFLAQTDAELSLVCPTADLPAQTEAREDGWRALRIEGVLDFSLVGILASLTTLLAEQQISVFAVSTYNTDYLLLREHDWERALSIFANAGHTVLPQASVRR